MDKPSAIFPGALDQFALKSSEPAADKGNLGQEAFFNLMITQLQNQDPFKPMESGDFLSQIAQFSTVNGITELQQSFATLASSLQSSQALQASTMVGRGVVIQADTFLLIPGQPVELSAELATASSNVRMTITDASGQNVNQVNLGQAGPGRVQQAWNGLDRDGGSAPAGRYSVSFDAVIDGQEQALQSAVTARVDSVSLSRDGLAPTLNVAGFGGVAMSDVLEIL